MLALSLDLISAGVFIFPVLTSSRMLSTILREVLGPKSEAYMETINSILFRQDIYGSYDKVIPLSPVAILS